MSHTAEGTANVTHLPSPTELLTGSCATLSPHQIWECHRRILSVPTTESLSAWGGRDSNSPQSHPWMGRDTSHCPSVQPGLGHPRDPGAATAALAIPAQPGIPNSQHPTHPCPLAVKPFPVSCPSIPVPSPSQLSWSPFRCPQLSWILLLSREHSQLSRGFLWITPRPAAGSGAALQVGSHLSRAQGHNPTLRDIRAQFQAMFPL